MAAASSTAVSEGSNLSSSSIIYRDNADEILPFRVETSSSDRDEQLIQVATTLCPLLQTPSPSSTNASVSPLLGGLSNELFLVERNEKRVLVRIHPQDENEDDATNDSHRNIENKLVAWLSQRSMAPIFYGRFINGRVEEFYDDTLPLCCDQMAAHAVPIAKIMANFHMNQMPTSIVPPVEGNDNAVVGHRGYMIDTWFETAVQQQANKTDTELYSCTMELHKEWIWVKQELERLPATATDDEELKQKQLKSLAFIREIVLTHMDCQPLNILKPKQSTDSNSDNLKLIDFEYSGWNSRAADMANTFCEHCNMTDMCQDYEKEYPTEEQQNTFLRSYLQQHQQQHDDFDLATLRMEVGRFTLVSHIGWAAWCIVKILHFQGQTGSNALADWDYMKYYQVRVDGYHLMKSWFCK